MGDPGIRGGAHRARLQGREVAELSGPWNPKQSGEAKIAKSSFEEEEIQNSAGRGVRACVWGWEVRVVPRARARAASVCMCVCVCVCVCVRERQRERDRETRGALEPWSPCR